jgi:hypothetical protein
MGLADLMKELRLLKGQGVCRYLMSWLLVFVHVCSQSKMFLLLVLLSIGATEGTVVKNAASKFVPVVVHFLVQFLHTA